MTLNAPPATLRLTVDRDALTHNWRTLDAMSGAARAGAAVKANAYGLGISKVAPTLREAGAQSFYLAHWSEVAALIEHVPADQVSVLHGPLSEADCAYARATGVRPVINSLYQAKLWNETGGGPCDLMVDTGINRLGLSMSEIGDPQVQNLQVETLMSHLASADEDSELNALQLQRFGEVTSLVEANTLSLANSAGIALGGDFHFDLTRPGLALYGGVPRPEMSESIRQVAHLQASIIQTRQLNAGDSVGYNATFTASDKMKVAVISLGYADGYLRCWSSLGEVQHNGQSLPVLGRVSMDMIVVDCKNSQDAADGDWVDVPWHLPTASKACGLSQYELLTGLGSRLRS